MEFIFEFFMELYFEFFLEGLVALWSAFLPKRFLAKKGKKTLSRICSAVSAVLVLVLMVAIAILAETEGQSFWAWFILCFCIIYFLAGVIKSLFLRKGKIIGGC